jgi:hypothetical protein
LGKWGLKGWKHRVENVMLLLFKFQGVYEFVVVY